MSRNTASWLILFFLTALMPLSGAAQAEGEIKWSAWSPEQLAKAKAEQRFIILDLEAVWCHWCHVMEETTYRDPEVVKLLSAKYLPIRVDQDANPGLSSRYGDWGWPATIIFAPDGTELVKRRGYIEPEQMRSLLQAVIDDPTPGPSVNGDAIITPAETSTLSADVKHRLAEAHLEAFDQTYGGWGKVHKFIDPDSMDLELLRAENADALARRRSELTLDSALALIDPVAGGIYQYSDQADWLSPHYEKIMWYQANGLRQYALAAALFRSDRYKAAAASIYRYMTERLQSADGAFFTSQDADVDRELHGKAFYALDAAERQKIGREPRIDTAIYARENGWAIAAIASYSSLFDDAVARANAVRAAEWIVAHRRRADGLFRHGEADRGGPFLGDTVAMGHAGIELYAATGDRKWLALARDCGKALLAFRLPAGGFATSLTTEGGAGVLATSYRNLDEQVHVARFALKLWRYSGDAATKDIADHAFRYLSAPEMAESGRMAAATLLIDFELSRAPTHITVVGRKDDPEAIALHTAARRYPAVSKRIDWWDMREGALDNPDVMYPELNRAAAFACSYKLCSLPAFSDGELQEVVATMLRHSAETPQVK